MIKFENKIGRKSVTSALTKEAQLSGLKLTDNHCYQDEAFPEDCVMSAMDDSQLLLPGSNLGGHQSFGAINMQISQINLHSRTELAGLQPSEV